MLGFRMQKCKTSFITIAASYEDCCSYWIINGISEDEQETLSHVAPYSHFIDQGYNVPNWCYQRLLKSTAPDSTWRADHLRRRLAQCGAVLHVLAAGLLAAADAGTPVLNQARRHSLVMPTSNPHIGRPQ